MSDLRKNFDELMDLFEAIKREVRKKDKHLYEQWHAYGLMVSDDFVHGGPTLSEVVDKLDYEEDEEEEENEEEENEEEELA